MFLPRTFGSTRMVSVNAAEMGATMEIAIFALRWNTSSPYCSFNRINAR